MPSRAEELTRLEATASTVADADAREHEKFNFATLALYQIVHRIGWIFKTESIVMPAFLDHIGGSDWLRGCLPMLNRFGQSIPPVLLSRRLKLMRRKKWALVAASVSTAVPFLALSVIWFTVADSATAWWPWVFLLLYALFFMINGLNLMTLHTLSGKLIQPQRRGRLMMVGMSIGAPAAIVAAAILLGPWLARSDHGFGHIFGFTGVVFLLTGLFGSTLREPTDDYTEEAAGPLYHFKATIRVLREDSDFRRLALVAALFSTVLMLFPHYQAMGRERLDLQLDSIMLWVIMQNAGSAVFGLLAGPVADRHGNRIVLRFLILCSAITPLLATTLATIHPQLGSQLYWIVFVPIGLTPLTVKLLANYTLEIASPEDHPRYISTIGLCLSVPIMVFSPIMGLLVSLTSFEVVFVTAAVVIMTAGLLTWRLDEPRHRNSA